MGRLKMKNNKTPEEEMDLVIYNDDQRWWVNIDENATASIKQLEDSIKLQKEIQILALSKIDELSD